jgi:hypothetical protein
MDGVREPSHHLQRLAERDDAAPPPIDRDVSPERLAGPALLASNPEHVQKIPSPIMMDVRQDAIEFSVDGRPQLAHRTWFRGENCNFNPDVENMRSIDAVLKHVLAGWLPPEPLIDSKTTIVAFGSCFAQHISTYLSQRNYDIATAKDGAHGDAYLVRFGEGLVNTFVIRQQFEWAFENWIPEQDFWPSYDARAFGYEETIRVSTRAILDSADLFIITLGLSEVWYDEVTGGAFWRAVPTEKYDPARHKFRVSSVADNVDNIKAIYRLIRKYRPSARVILTLSPIPLVATFRPCRASPQTRFRRRSCVPQSTRRTGTSTSRNRSSTGPLMKSSWTLSPTDGNPIGDTSSPRSSIS